MTCKEKTAREYFADILVEGKVIVELKSVDDLEKIYEAQLLNYLKANGIQAGLLVNFRHPKAQIKRMVVGFPEGRNAYLPLRRGGFPKKFTTFAQKKFFHSKEGLKGILYGSALYNN